MPILGAYAPSAWRVHVDWSESGSLTATDYVLERVDSGPSQSAVTHVIALDFDALAVELTLSQPLLSNTFYTVTSGGSSAQFKWQDPTTGVLARDPVSDPEAEVFGRDADWLFGGFTADGDIEEVRGVRCVLEDSLAVLYLKPGELVQYPTSGADFPSRVNGPSSAAIAQNLQARAEAEWRRDDRIVDCSAETVIKTDGSVDVNGRLKTVAISHEIELKTS